MLGCQRLQPRMTPSSLRHVCTALAAFLLAVTIGATISIGIAQSDRQPPDLTGAWTLNRDLSTRRDGRRGGDGQDPGERPRRGGFGGGTGRRGGFGGRGNMPSREEMERMRAAMDLVMRPSLKLTIVRNDTGLILTDEHGRSTRVTLDGKKTKSSLDGVEFETSARWDQWKLRVERKFKGNLKAIDEYSISADPKQLIVVTTVEGGGGRGGRGRSIRRVYDPAEQTEFPPSPERAPGPRESKASQPWLTS